MTVSMTSFARIDFENQSISGSWEIKSVNHRFIEISLKVPDEFRNLELSAKKSITACANRGKIDCYLRINNHNNAVDGLVLDKKVISDLLDSIGDISSRTSNKISLNALDLLKWPGVIRCQSSDEDLEKYLVHQLKLALKDFTRVREKEGKELQNAINARLLLMDELLAQIKLTVPSIIKATTERYKLKMKQFINDLEPTRLEQECALLINKLDVSEEVDRIAIHIQETRSALNLKEPIGRRLDFLMQELLREANTLGSKSAHADSSGYAIELKVLIEQIKEQIQNVE